MSAESSVAIPGWKRALWIFLVAFQAAFAVISLRYVDAYFRPGAYAKAAQDYFAHAATTFTFLAHVIGNGGVLLLGCLLILQRQPFQPRKVLTPLYLGLAVFGGLFGFYYSWYRRPFDVSTYITLTIQVLAYYATYMAAVHMRDPDPLEHRRWATWLWAMSAGAAIWRVVFITLMGPETVARVSDPERAVTLATLPEYHTAWFISFMIGAALGAALNKWMIGATPPRAAASPSLELDGAFGGRR